MCLAGLLVAVCTPPASPSLPCIWHTLPLTPSDIPSSSLRPPIVGRIGMGPQGSVGGVRTLYGLVGEFYAWRSLRSMYQVNKLTWIFIACKKRHTDAPSLKMTKMSSTNPLSIKSKRKQPPIFFVIGSLFDVVELLPLLCVFSDFYVCMLSGNKYGIPRPQTCMQQCMLKQCWEFSSALLSHYFLMTRWNMKSQTGHLQ